MGTEGTVVGPYRSYTSLTSRVSSQVSLHNTLQKFDTSNGMDLPSKTMYDTFKDEIWKGKVKCSHHCSNYNCLDCILRYTCCVTSISCTHCNLMVFKCCAKTLTVTVPKDNGLNFRGSELTLISNPFEHIYLELGPLDPDWFKVLTTQTFTSEENCAHQDDQCTNGEGHTKTQSDKPTMDSQLFSTPKVFSQSGVSLENGGEQSFTDRQGKAKLNIFETLHELIQLDHSKCIL